MCPPYLWGARPLEELKNRAGYIGVSAVLKVTTPLFIN